MSEVKIIFDQLIFLKAILGHFENPNNEHGLTLNEGDNFILSMDWAWRAPDKENFNSALAIDATSVLEKKQTGDSSINLSSGDTPTTVFKADTPFVTEHTHNILEHEKLRIRTNVSGESTIKFSLIYADKIFKSSFLTTSFKKLGGLFITKVTGGIGSALKGVLTAVGNNALQEVFKSSDDDDKKIYVLGKGELVYNGNDGQFSIELLDQVRGTNMTVAILELTIEQD